MSKRTIQVDDTVYQRLIEKSAQLHTTPSDLIEHWLNDPGTTVLPQDAEEDEIQPLSTIEEALAAVAQLANLFPNTPAGVVEEALSDPMPMLINSDFAE